MTDLRFLPAARTRPAVCDSSRRRLTGGPISGGFLRPERGQPDIHQLHRLALGPVTIGCLVRRSRKRGSALPASMESGTSTVSSWDWPAVTQIGAALERRATPSDSPSRVSSSLKGSRQDFRIPAASLKTTVFTQSRR